ncbi:MAG TPA: hypothetical protein VIC26_15140 [Marinagarivorans sp.]
MSNKKTARLRLFAGPNGSGKITLKDDFIDTYVKIYIAYLFRKSNGSATRIWLDIILKQEAQQAVDWNLANKDDYFSTI